MLFENIVLGALFFFLVPGILVSLPQGGSKFTVAFVHAIVFVLAYMVLQYLANYGGYDYAVYEGYEGYEYEDEDEEGFQMKKVVNPVKKTGGIISPEEQLKKNYNFAADKCSYYGNLKDNEYRKERTATKRFRQLESLQRDYCDKANNLRNKIRDL